MPDEFQRIIDDGVTSKGTERLERIAVEDILDGYENFIITH